MSPWCQSIHGETAQNHTDHRARTPLPEDRPLTAAHPTTLLKHENPPCPFLQTLSSTTYLLYELELLEFDNALPRS